MKKLLLVSVAAFVIQSQVLAKTAKDTFLEVLNYAQASSPFAHQINWDAIKKEGVDFIKDRKAKCTAASAIANILVPPLFQKDRHTFVTLDGFDANDCPIPNIQSPSEAMLEWMNLDAETKKPILQYCENFHGRRIGEFSYVYIPAGYAWKQTDINARIHAGRQALSDAQVSSTKGIILDFRHNFGGNNVPMLLSISALLPNDILFKFSPDIAISLDKGGNRLVENYQNEIFEYGRYDSSAPVDVISKPTILLINGLTGSSGAISAFVVKHSLANVKVVGEPSSDTLSVNESYPLPDGNYFNLMIFRIFSKDNKMSPLSLAVDEFVSHDYSTMFSDQDQQINRAIAILTQSSPLNL